MSNANESTAEDVTFSISRTLDAPRDLVWTVWTQERHLAEWFGPKNVPLLTARLDFRVGGVFHYSLRTPDGHDMWGKWTFTVITPPERFEFIMSFADADGRVVPSPFKQPPFDQWPLEIATTVRFTESAGRTTVTLTAVPHNAPPERSAAFKAGQPSMAGGWGGTFERLTDYLNQLNINGSRS